MSFKSVVFWDVSISCFKTPYYPSSVIFGGVNRGRLLETRPGSAFICFVASRKHHDIPGFEHYLTEEGYTLSGKR